MKHIFKFNGGVDGVCLCPTLYKSCHATKKNHPPQLKKPLILYKNAFLSNVIHLYD